MTMKKENSGEIVMYSFTPSMLAEHLSEKGALTPPIHNYLKINNLHISGTLLACLVNHQASYALRA